MAKKQQTRRTTQRKTVDPRNTFDFTTPNLQAQARPVDPYVEPNAGQRARQLAQTLGVAKDTIDMAKPFLNEYAEQQYEEGRMAAITGEDKPSDGYYRVTAYEKANGELTASTEYKETLSEYYRQNYTNTSPEEFQEGLEEITKEFVEGRTDNFLQGFAPKAQQLEQSVVSEYNSFQAEEFHRKSLNTVGSLSREGINDVVNQNIADRYQDVGITNIEDLEQNPQMYVTVMKDETFRESLAKDLRKQLSEIQKKGKDMGLSTSEISEKFVEFLGTTAIENGMPEIINMAYEKDESGVSLATGIFSKTIASSEDKAENVRSQRLQEFTKEQEELTKEEQQQQKEEREAALKQYQSNIREEVTLLDNISDPTERATQALETQQRLIGNEEFDQLDNTTQKQLLNDVTAIRKKAIKDLEAEAEELEEESKERLQKQQEVKKNTYLANTYREVTNVMNIQDPDEKAKASIDLQRKLTDEDMFGKLDANKQRAILEDLSNMRNEELEEIRTSAEQARKEQQRAIAKAKAEAAEKRRKLFVNNVDTRIITEIATLEDPAVRAKNARMYLEQLKQDEEFMSLPNTDVRRITESLQTFANKEDSFPSSSDDQTFADLYGQATRGTLTHEDLKFAKDMGDLSRDDWQELYDRVTQNNQAALEEKRKWKDEDLVFDLIDLTAENLVEKQMGSFTDNQTATGWKTALYDEIIKYKKDHDGKGPDWDTFVKDILNPKLETHGTSYGEIIQGGLGGKEDESKTEVDLEAEEQKVIEEAKGSEYAEDAQRVGPIEGILERFGYDTANMEWFRARSDKEEFGDYNPEAWDYELEEAHENIRISLEEKDMGISELREMLSSYMGSEAGADYYIYTYLYNYANDKFVETIDDAEVSTTEAMENVRNDLIENLDVPPDMAEDIIKGIGKSDLGV